MTILLHMFNENWRVFLRLYKNDVLYMIIKISDFYKIYKNDLFYKFYRYGVF